MVTVVCALHVLPNYESSGAVALAHRRGSPSAYALGLMGVGVYMLGRHRQSKERPMSSWGNIA